MTQYDENAEKYGYEGEMTPLKCDELKVYRDPKEGPCYREFYEKTEVDAAIAEKDNEIAELKQKLEDVQASMYADVVDANMENRRLRRALWLARAELCHRLDVDRYLRNHRHSRYNEEFLSWADACVAMETKMCKAETKCRAKAEEYK